MKNGFGLRFLHKFLNIPYLFLQRQSLLQQIETNARQTDETRRELEKFLLSDEADYEKFSDALAQKRRIKAEELAPNPTLDLVTASADKKKPPGTTLQQTRSWLGRISSNFLLRVLKRRYFRSS